MLKVAFLWHMHQPYYRDPATGHMSLPWVRLHSLKDYYDLPARLADFNRLKMTFNLVPSLIEQVDLYCEGKTSDRHLDLTRKPTNKLSFPEKAEIYRTFFMANPETMIKPYPRFRRLFRKLRDCSMDADMAARTSSNQEIRDLVVWGNLVWIDPFFRKRRPFSDLFARGENFTENDKLALVEAQFEIMKDIIPNYRRLLETDKIDISFTPYFHPILPLLCDTDSAREALPGITLPKNRFCHPEDAEKQIVMAIEMFRNKFGRDLTGMWASEGSISETALAIMARHGIRWTASDEQVLYGSLAKSGLSRDEKTSPYGMYQHNTPEGSINIFFRDHALSDRIGFVYSGWEAEKAVDDFMKQLYSLNRKFGGEDSQSVVPVILDGENCWEYYRNDGDSFLRLLLEKLDTDQHVETITFSDACRRLKSQPLRHILAGSWINHNFRVWIGHPEDNTAWDILWEARRTLTQFKEDHPDFDPEKIARAEKSLLAAEGSDWNWWYGDEHRGPQNEIFDRIYRAHLGAVHSSLGLEIPKALLLPISSGLPDSYITSPEGTVTPIIDGKLTHYYEWLGAGRFDCLKAGGTMHRADRIMKNIYYVSDDDHIYLRVDFVEKSFLVDNDMKRLKVIILSPGRGELVFGAGCIETLPDWAGDKGNISCGIGEIAEIGLPKRIFFPDGRGEILFRIAVSEENKDLEIWPEGDPIRFHFAGEGEEIVWDL